MQIKTIFEWDFAYVFQNKVNKFLKEKEDLLDIIDIKYSTTISKSGSILFSAIVIYKNNV